MRPDATSAALALLLISASPIPAATKGPTPDAGRRPAPPQLKIAQWINSRPLAQEDVRGKVVVVDFWAPLRGPCRRLMPRLEKLYARHKDAGLLVVGVTEDTRTHAEEFAKRFKITYPLGIDDKGENHAAYGVKSLPTSWLIGRDGYVAWKGPGDKLTAKMILAELQKHPPPNSRPSAQKPAASFRSAW